MPLLVWEIFSIALPSVMFYKLIILINIFFNFLSYICSAVYNILKTYSITSDIPKMYSVNTFFSSSRHSIILIDFSSWSAFIILPDFALRISQRNPLDCRESLEFVFVWKNIGRSGKNRCGCSVKIKDNFDANR